MTLVPLSYLKFLVSDPQRVVQELQIGGTSLLAVAISGPAG